MPDEVIVERRREPRIQASQPAQLTVLGEQERTWPATVVDLSGRGLRVRADSTVAVGAAVKVEINDALLLGDVCYSIPESGGYLIGVEVDQVLSGLSDVAKLNRALLMEQSAPRGAEVKAAGAGGS